jgi:hypothetical protein
MVKKRHKHIADPEKRWARRNQIAQRVARREALAKAHAQAKRINKRAATLPEVHLV